VAWTSGNAVTTAAPTTTSSEPASPVEPADVPGLAERLPARDRVLAELREGEATAEELAETTGLPLSTVRNALTGLRKTGLATVEHGAKNEPGRWRFPNPDLYKGGNRESSTQGPLASLAMELGARPLEGE